jgi:16S rRNA (cytosine1402-N4)-methyltransferase
MADESSLTKVRHVPVLPAEVLGNLSPGPGQTIVDATIGSGGHARLIAERLAPGGRLIGLDQDPVMLDLARSRLDKVHEPVSFTLQCANFSSIRDVLNEMGIGKVDGVLADLGVCSDQLDQADRGMSFLQPGPLDMRLNQRQGEPASSLLSRLNERDLADIFWNYGEERYSRRIARRILATRREHPIKTTEDLAKLVRSSVVRSGSRHRIDPATRVFQALRIAVNDELGALEGFLSALPECVHEGGRAVVISFHSLEDRRVKQAFRDRQRWQLLTKQPIQAGAAELRANPRARSAKLRAVRRTGT